MRTVRRLYFYAIALASLEVVVWGLIKLARSLLEMNTLGGPLNELAGSLALVLVGAPVFVLHWRTIQKEVEKDMEERAAWIRPVFFYATLASTLAPCVQNLMSLANRLALSALQLHWAPLIGRGQTTGDNLAAIVVNLAAAAYFRSILKMDWEADIPGNNLASTRRLYRFLWVGYGLAITVFGVQQITLFLTFAPGGLVNSAGWLLADGLAFLAVGVPLWIWTWDTTQRARNQAGEADSLLRLVVLYFLSLIGVGTVLSSGAVVAALALRWGLGETQTLADFLSSAGTPLSLALPLGGVWAYYGKVLRHELSRIEELPRQGALHRLYNYILSAFGLTATIFGMQQVLSFLINLTVSDTLWGASLRNQLCAALASLLVGLPLWWTTWTRMQKEAQNPDDLGDHARRSIIRKAYLYLVLFAGVIGVMATAGNMFYLIFRRLLGETPTGFLKDVLDWAQSLAVFSVWLIYHIRVLRRDGLTANRVLAQRHSHYNVLALEGGDNFLSELKQALQRIAPTLPVTFIEAKSAKKENLSQYQAVLLPEELVIHQNTEIRALLAGYTGTKLIIPNPDGERESEAGKWLWLGARPEGSRALAHAAAQLLRQLAEGQPTHLSSPIGVWQVLGYLFAAQMIFLLIMSLVSLVASNFNR